jgi:hypothetical protein
VAVVLCGLAVFVVALLRRTLGRRRSGPGRRRTVRQGAAG